MCSRKHYQTIAAAINQTRQNLTQDVVDADVEDLDPPHPTDRLRELTSTLINALADENPNFDRDRFLIACGFEVD
jgi:hypothetical protein